MSRSSRLCRYVEGAVGGNGSSEFLAFEDLLARLLQVVERVPLSSESAVSFGQRNHVDFSRFKLDFYADLPKKVSALLVWRAINTFLKGSIEAYQSPSGMLSKEHFLHDLGKNRCRIVPELRIIIYGVFLQYQKWLLKNDLWDNCDRIRTLVKKIEHAKMGDPTAFEEINVSRIYIDVRFILPVAISLLLCVLSLTYADFYFTGSARLHSDRGFAVLSSCKGPWRAVLGRRPSAVGRSRHGL